MTDVVNCVMRWNYIVQEWIWLNWLFIARNGKISGTSLKT